MLKAMQKWLGQPDAAIPTGSRPHGHYPSLWLLIIVIPIVLAFINIAMKNWNVVFDDAYISYRYAQNLAMGHGITWNPGFPPTEGYTNFLLVLILAPVIWAGIDPLLFTRILSFVSVIVIAGMLFSAARRNHHCSATTASMIAAIIFLVPATEGLCLVGLETVIYACLLLITFVVGVTFVDSGKPDRSVLFSCLLFLTMLLRPEAALLYPVISITFLVSAIRRKISLKPLMPGLLALLVLGGTYLAWKYVHFGQLLPNPFYLKASGHTIISPDGLQSVIYFLQDYAILLFLVVLGLVLAAVHDRREQRGNTRVTVMGLAFVVVYCLFFIHVDTLMDAYGRFLYPLVPLIIWLAIPALAKVLGLFESIAASRNFVLPVLMLAFLLVLAPEDISRLYERINSLFNYREFRAPQSYMQKELEIAKALARFPQISEVRIAFADAGVIPYYTGSIWLDVVGLNDSFIAKTRNKNSLVDYFFIWSPDLVIHPGKVGLSWLQVGHGALGDYLSWSNDPRWDGYEYAGTSRMDDIPYDLQYFVNKSSRFREPLEAFLKKNVVDGWYDPFPLAIGTYYPRENQATWWHR